MMNIKPIYHKIIFTEQKYLAHHLILLKYSFFIEGNTIDYFGFSTQPRFPVQ